MHWLGKAHPMQTVLPIFKKGIDEDDIAITQRKNSQGDSYTGRFEL
jgi:hypothetical protein